MFEKMSTPELSAHAQSKSKPAGYRQPRWGRFWPLLLVWVPWNLIQCTWASQLHSGESFYGMPMNLVWVWFSIALTALAVVDLGMAARDNKRHLQALTELIARSNAVSPAHGSDSG